jgi:hypothetical protein
MNEAMSSERSGRERGAVQVPGPPSPTQAAPLPASSDHLVIVGGDRFDVPSRLPFLPVAIATTAASAWLLRSAFALRGLGGHAFSDATGLLGFGGLLLACQAFRRWIDLR